MTKQLSIWNTEVMSTHNSSAQEQRQEELELEASFGYI